MGIFCMRAGLYRRVSAVPAGNVAYKTGGTLTLVRYKATAQ
jgi:hypothetical protein